LIKKITTEKPTGDSDLHRELYKGIEKQKIQVKHVATEGKVYVLIHPCDEEFKQMFLAPFEMFFESGLGNLAATQKNQIEALVSSN